MSHRLQVLIPDDLDARLRQAARRESVSKGEWVRRAIETALRRSGGPDDEIDPLARLSSLDGPTGGIEQMLSEIEAGRG